MVSPEKEGDVESEDEEEIARHKRQRPQDKTVGEKKGSRRK